MGISVRRLSRQVVVATVAAVAVGIFATGGAEAAASSAVTLADVSAGVRIDMEGVTAAVTACVPGDDRWT